MKNKMYAKEHDFLTNCLCFALNEFNSLKTIVSCTFSSLFDYELERN
jgi:hypothetical protein